MPPINREGLFVLFFFSVVIQGLDLFWFQGWRIGFGARDFRGTKGWQPGQPAYFTHHVLNLAEERFIQTQFLLGILASLGQAFVLVRVE